TTKVSDFYLVRVIEERYLVKSAELGVRSLEGRTFCFPPLLPIPSFPNFKLCNLRSLALKFYSNNW
ncbi:hypothetical protein KBT16_30395, partial [Nostoc sp. CCCryo 231-06]|nr:hypothetical protein [Nostoc sp. CCCryo 231-06]